MNISKSQEGGTISTINIRFLNLKKEVQNIHDQSSQFHSRQDKVPYLKDILL